LTTFDVFSITERDKAFWFDLLHPSCDIYLRAGFLLVYLLKKWLANRTGSGNQSPVLISSAEVLASVYCHRRDEKFLCYVSESVIIYTSVNVQNASVSSGHWTWERTTVFDFI